MQYLQRLDEMYGSHIFVANALQTKKYKMNYSHADASNHSCRLHKKQMKDYLFPKATS